MASRNVDQQSADVEPKSKKLKLDRSENNINADCPLFQLPDDILAKIVGYVPIPQWPDMELISTKFRDVLYLAWRSLHHVNLDVDFKFEPISNVVEIWDEKFMPSIVCILEKLTERAPFIKSLKGVRFQVVDPNLNATVVDLLSKFENLEAIGFSRHRIRLYPRSFFLRRPARTSARGMTARMSTGGIDDYRDRNLEIRVEDLLTFMESTRSRATLKEIVVEGYTADDIGNFLDAFALRRMRASLVNNAEDRQRMRLDKLIINGAPYDNWKSTIENIDPLLDSSTLTSLSLNVPPLKPELLSNLIQSTPNLRHLGFAFIACPTDGDKGPHNRLMDTLATHPNVNELYIFASSYGFDADLDYRRFVQMLKSIGPRLRLFGSDALFGESIAVAIFSHMRELKSLHLRVDEMSTEDIKKIVRLPVLEEISLKSMKPRINDDIIVTIGQSTRLKSLRLLVCASFFEDPSGISLMGLAALTTLTKLEIDQCSRNITNDVFVAWGNGFGSTLEELRFAKVPTDAHPGLIDLIKKANRLRVFDLKTSTLTNGILDAVATSCPNIVYIGGVPIVQRNFVAVQRIIDACPKLNTLRTEYSIHTESAGYQDLRAQLKIDKYRNIRIH